jgi:succinate dehydrogenase / fumarate reductase flavoprotein subunit
MFLRSASAQERHHTSLAAGGINAALATMDAEDSWQLSTRQTPSGGAFSQPPRGQEIGSKERQPRHQDRLERWGMPVRARVTDVSASAISARTSINRTAFAEDYTDLRIRRTLIAWAAQLDVPILDSVTGITRVMVRDSEVVFSAYGFDLRGSRIDGHRRPQSSLPLSPDTIASGVAPQPPGTKTGDSFKLAVDAAARLCATPS